MATQLTADDAKQSLTAHVEAKGAEIFAKYGPQIGRQELLAMMEDRSCVRYPCSIEFDSSRLQPGEVAYPEPKGSLPEEGFTLFVHPAFESRPSMVPYLILYQLVVVNYGEFASSGDAEAFAAAALGLDRELYYQVLCSLADELGGPPDTGDGDAAGHAHAGCTCGG